MTRALRLGVADAGLIVAGAALTPDPAGALWWEAERLLIVADLHFEKGSAYAARRVFLPPYDTAATLARLAALVAHYRPACVAALGDSFHDARALSRIAPADAEALRALGAGRDWIWIAGNHDRETRGDFGEAHGEWRLGPLVFRHEPRPGAQPGEIAGHLHPAARIASRAGVLRRRCFLGDGTRAILPAFGAFTGGLNIRDAAFGDLFAVNETSAHLIGRNAVHRAPMARCLPD